MAKYMIRYHWCDGDEDDDNNGNYWDTEEEAEDAALDGLSCAKVGGQLLHMSNPGDYPYDESDYEDNDFEIIEVDDD